MLQYISKPPESEIQICDGALVLLAVRHCHRKQECNASRPAAIRASSLNAAELTPSPSRTNSVVKNAVTTALPMYKMSATARSMALDESKSLSLLAGKELDRDKADD